MSYVTNFVLLCSPCINMRLVNNRLSNAEVGESYGSGFKQIDEYSGGPKHMEADVFGLASNYGKVSTVLAAIEDAIEVGAWDGYFDYIQVLVLDQHDYSGWTMCEFTGDGWATLSPIK